MTFTHPQRKLRNIKEDLCRTTQTSKKIVPLERSQDIIRFSLVKNIKEENVS